MTSDVSYSPRSPRWWRMTLKELREILRDRRTIITLVAMPLLVYPLLGVTLQKLLISQLTARSKIEYRIALEAQRDAERFRRLFGQGHVLVAKREGRQLDPTQKPAGTADDPFIRLIIPDDPERTVDLTDVVSSEEADVGVRMGRRGEGISRPCEILYRAASPLSRDVRRFVEDRFRAANEEFARGVFAQNLPQVALPFEVTLRSLETEGGDAGPAFSLATLVPLILILMTVTGAVYPAIDLTAGERERGTLEALVSAPVPRHELLFAKYLAVLSVALLTAVANLISMVVTAYASNLESLLFGAGGLSLRVMVSTLGLLGVFAAFFSAVILVLTSFARSFKEAQAYLIPLMLVSIAPGVLCLLPGIEFNGWLAVTPLVNIVLLARDVFDHRAASLWTLATLASTVLYAAVALAAAARIFGTDAVLYGSEGGWSDLFRRPEARRSAPTLGQALFALAVLFPAFLVLSGLPGRLGSLAVAGRLTINAAITVLLFAVFPSVLILWMKVKWRSGLSLHTASVAAFVSAALLGLSLWPFAYELEVMALSPERLDAFRELFESLKVQLDAVPLWAKLLALAIVPAACEELFFRGYLLTAFRTGMSTPLAIALSGMLFGLFHVIVRDSLFFERFVPTCFLGLILGWVCVRTRSVWPGMLLHMLHNGLLLTLSNYTEQLKALGVGVEERQHLPALWLTVAAAVASGALTLLTLNAPTHQEDVS